MEPIPENQPADDIWKNAFTSVYRDDLKDWHSRNEWGRAQLMARHDMTGTGDLFTEALKHYSPDRSEAESQGGVQRLFSQMKGGTNG